MTVKIIRKQAEGVTDAMLLAVAEAYFDGGRKNCEDMRQAMEAARTGEIERIEIGKYNKISIIGNELCIAHYHGEIYIKSENIIPLSDALRELGMQLQGKP